MFQRAGSRSMIPEIKTQEDVSKSIVTAIYLSIKTKNAIRMVLILCTDIYVYIYYFSCITLNIPLFLIIIYSVEDTIFNYSDCRKSWY